ncbi:MAG: TRAP transporter small permease subunit [Pseudomonadota bacterium]
MQNLARWIDLFQTKLASVIKWLGLAMVIVTIVVVVLRYIFNTGAIALQESVMYMHGLLFLLGIPYGVLSNTHVRVDIVYARQTGRIQNLINLTGHILFLLPISLFIFWTSLPYVEASWRVFEGSAEVGGLPAVFLLKTMIPVMALLLFLQAASQIIKCIGEHRTGTS